MKYALCDERISDELISILKEHEITPVLLPPYSMLSEPVASHPDMLCFYYLNTLYTYGGYYYGNKKLFDILPCNIKIVSNEPKEDYPNDISLNAFHMGNILYGKLDCIAKEISDLFPNKVYLKQGYSKCSSCILNSKALITADKSIRNAAEKNGIDVLAIQNGDIALNGYNYGFIGGASAMLSKNELLFFGDITKHRDHGKIIEFLKKYNINPVFAKSHSLYDYGGIIIIE